MFARLFAGLVAWLLMAVPRPNPEPRHVPPGGAPPTPPPGYEGDWPPRPTRPSTPPTPPPGYDGDWPPTTGRPSLGDRLDAIIRRLELMLEHRAYQAHADGGVRNLLFRRPADAGGSDVTEA